MTDRKRLENGSDYFGLLYDYPMSWDFWRWICREQGGFDPGPCETAPVKEQDVKLSPRGASPGLLVDIRRLENRIEQLEAFSLFLQKKLNEHIDRPKKRSRQLKAIDT